MGSLGSVSQHAVCQWDVSTWVWWEVAGSRGGRDEIREPSVRAKELACILRLFLRSLTNINGVPAVCKAGSRHWACNGKNANKMGTFITLFPVQLMGG